MSVLVGDRLPRVAMTFLEGGNTAVVSTTGDDGSPWSGVASWVRATDEHTVHLIVAASSRTLANVRANGRMMLQLLGDGFVYGVLGAAQVVREQLDGAPVPAALVEFHVELVKDDLTPGREFHARITSWWQDPARQRVEERGLELLRALTTAAPAAGAETGPVHGAAL